MKKKINIYGVLVVLTLVLFISGCNKKTVNEEPKQNNEQTSNNLSTNEVKEVEVIDITGKVIVPVNPQKVVALDNRTFETLSSWGVKLLAAPKNVMPKESPYYSDDSVKNIGNHREPNLELIAEVDPELVIVGQRFAKYASKIRELVPNAVVLDLSWDVSGEKGSSGKNLIEGLKTSTLDLGKIFNKNDEAEKLVAEFEQTINDVKSAYKKEQKIIGVVVSGGKIGYSAPFKGRVWGPLFEVFEWTPALEVSNTSTDHKGDEISVEAIATSNPDWIFVMDRDASVKKQEEYTPAKEIIESSEALKNVTAVKNNQVIYSPSDTYFNESIQTFIELFQEMAKSLAK